MNSYSNLDRRSETRPSAMAVTSGVEGDRESQPVAASRNDDPEENSSVAAQSDLDAALQLLADRAQYITGAGGAAIALCRPGREDMLCCASAGETAPELGTLLSVEFGLSGESVRLRQPLRCDDAEQDSRVNREGCRGMGIASVMVMPIIYEDQVLGVFELFSGNGSAFGDRDMAALKRLSGMVETAIRLNRASENRGAQTGEKFAARKPPRPEVSTLPNQISTRTPNRAPDGPAVSEMQTPLPKRPSASVSAPGISERAKPAAKKPLFWSAAPNPNVEQDQPAEGAGSHIPAVFRNLHKCQACGFPVSEGRILCVECEEKKWRGKLKTSGTAASSEPARATVAAVAVLSQSIESQAAVPQTAAPGGVPSLHAPARLAAVDGALAVSDGNRSCDSAPIFSSSSGDSSESWLWANKYILGSLLVVAGGIAAFMLLR
jgi:GAF domain